MIQDNASFTFLHRIEEVELNIEDGRWQSALALALTLPDICGGIAFPEIVKRYRDGRAVLDRNQIPTRDVGNQYIRWFDTYAAPFFKVSAQDMPASVLRNARRLFLFSSAQNGSSSPVETGGGYVMTDEITNVQSGYFTQERIQGDLDYRRAQTIAKKMLDDGLISVAEFNKLTAINRETFSPLFAEIMPKIP